MIKLKNPSPRKIAQFLKKTDLAGKSILHFTGSMWGIGAFFPDFEAANKIRQLKQRDKSEMIVLLPELSWFETKPVSVPWRLKVLMQQYFPGNLSLAFEPDTDEFNDIALNNKVAFRVPQDPLLREFIAQVGRPLISSSINLSHLPPETDLDKILKNYAHWFDITLLPHPRVFASEKTPSTLAEYGVDERGGESIKCLREGSIPCFEVQNSFAKPTVMFVCTGNICRSPMAEKLFAKYLAQRGLNYRADSCGLLEGGHSMSISSMQLLTEAGVENAAEHVSKLITPQMVSGSWLLLTMEERQRDFLRSHHPEAMHKILTLNELTGYTGDIEDPYGSEHENYIKTFEIIDDRLKILLAMIEKQQIKL